MIEGRIVLRYSVAFLFLWFGYQQLFHPADWVGFLPEWTGYFPMPGNMLVQLNGWLELLGGGLLAAGFFTRAASAVLGVHLFLIALSIGIGEALGIRDAVLALATLSLVFDAADKWTIDAR